MTSRRGFRTGDVKSTSQALDGGRADPTATSTIVEVVTASGNELTVGELSARSGVAISALHFYEKKGLITSRRTGGNQRRYRRDVLRRVALVRIGQRVGIPLAEIAAVLASLPDGRTPNRRDWLELFPLLRTRRPDAYASLAEQATRIEGE